MLRFDHVAIAVARKFCVESIARLAGLAVAEIVRQDEKVARGVQRLARVKKFARELGPQEIAAISSGPVKDQHRILNAAEFINPRRTECAVMHPQIRQDFSRSKMKITKDEIRGLHWRKARPE